MRFFSNILFKIKYKKIETSLLKNIKSNKLGNRFFTVQFSDERLWAGSQSFHRAEYWTAGSRRLRIRTDAQTAYTRHCYLHVPQTIWHPPNEYCSAMGFRTLVSSTTNANSLRPKSNSSFSQLFWGAHDHCLDFN